MAAYTIQLDNDKVASAPQRQHSKQQQAPSRTTKTKARKRKEAPPPPPPPPPPWPAHVSDSVHVRPLAMCVCGAAWWRVAALTFAVRQPTPKPPPPTTGRGATPVCPWW